MHPNPLYLEQYNPQKSGFRDTVIRSQSLNHMPSVDTQSFNKGLFVSSVLCTSFTAVTSIGGTILYIMLYLDPLWHLCPGILRTTWTTGTAMRQKTCSRCLCVSRCSCPDRGRFTNASESSGPRHSGVRPSSDRGHWPLLWIAVSVSSLSTLALTSSSTPKTPPARRPWPPKSESSGHSRRYVLSPPTTRC